MFGSWPGDDEAGAGLHVGVVGDIWPKWVGVAPQIGTEVGSQGQWDSVEGATSGSYSTASL